MVRATTSLAGDDLGGIALDNYQLRMTLEQRGGLS